MFQKVSASCSTVFGPCLKKGPSLWTSNEDSEQSVLQTRQCSHFLTFQRSAKKFYRTGQMSHVLKVLMYYGTVSYMMKTFRNKCKRLLDHVLNPTGPRSAVGNVSGSRCESDCRSRGQEFDHGPVPYFHGD